MLPGLRHPLDVLSRRLARPAAAPLAVAGMAFAAIAWTLVQRTAALPMPAYNTACFEQLVWNLGPGRGLASGFFGGSSLGLPALVIGAAFGPLLGQRPAAAEPVLGRLLACTTALPATAPVAVDDSAAAPLAARPVEEPLTYGRPSDWVDLDRAGRVPDYVHASARGRELAALPGQGRRRYCDDGRFQLWGPAGSG